MKKYSLLLGFIVLSIMAASCIKEKKDRVKVVEMTIYPETGYGAAIMSDYLTQPLVFSESDDNRKRILTDIIFDGFNINYERGYQYKLKVKKVWMQDPPQDVSSIKYVFLKLLSKKKVITKDSEEDLILFVASAPVKFMPRYPAEYQDNGYPRVYNALKVKIRGADNWMALIKIDGFNYEAGYEYELKVRKITHADPYSVEYQLLDVLSKKKGD